jgi:hypothetical protein
MSTKVPDMSAEVSDMKAEVPDMKAAMFRGKFYPIEEQDNVI